MFHAEEHCESAKQPKDFNVFVLRKQPFDIHAQNTFTQMQEVDVKRESHVYKTGTVVRNLPVGISITYPIQLKSY